MKLFIFGAGATYGTLGRRGVKGFGRELARQVPHWRSDRLYAALAPFAREALKPGESETDNWDLDLAWTKLDYLAKLWRGLAGLGVDRDNGGASVAIHRAAAAVYGPLDHDYLSRAWHSAESFTLRDILLTVTSGDLVVSFNWDVLIERLLVLRFAGTPVRLVQAPHQAVGEAVTIAKPHGSLSWRRELPPQGDAPDFLGAAPEPLLDPMDPEEISDRKQPLLLGAVPIKSELLIEVQNRHPWVHRRIMEQWSALSRALRDAEELHVVGYGFPAEDQYGLFMLREAVQRRPAPCRAFLYEVPGKRCDEVASRLAELVGVPLNEIQRRGPVRAPHPGRAPPLRMQIAQAAYFRWCDRGGAHGHDLDDWLLAELDFGAPVAERPGGRPTTSEAPIGDEEPGRWDLYVDLLLPAVTSLRQRLRIDEDLFRSHTFHTAPRDFVLWTALDEVAKTAMFLMKLDGHLGDDPAVAAQGTGWIERTSVSLIVEEERLRARRLCELLSQLVLFAQKDEEAYYRHFLLLEEFCAANWFNEDLQTFHGARSAWVQFGVDQTAAEVTQVEAGIDFTQAWYANYRPPLDPTQWQWRRALSGARHRIRAALPNMTEFERLSMGTTYDEAFGQPSAAIHYRAGASTLSRSTGETEVVLAEGAKLGMLGFCVVRRCFMLLGRPMPSPAAQIATVLEQNTEASRRFTLLNERPSIAVGDFVVVRGYLGEVIEETTSPFGYRSLRVELLAERPIPDLAVDWFRARDVVRIFSRAALLRGVASVLGGANAHRADGADLRASVIGAWNQGLREQLHSQMFAAPGGGTPPRA